MERTKIDFVSKIRKVDYAAIQEIIDIFNQKGITELDVSNHNNEFDDVKAYCFNDDCHSADNIKINKVVVRNGYLYLIDDDNVEHSTKDFHEGTFPYIYNAVYWISFSK